VALTRGVERLIVNLGVQMFMTDSHMYLSMERYIQSMDVTSAQAAARWQANPSPPRPYLAQPGDNRPSAAQPRQGSLFQSGFGHVLVAQLHRAPGWTLCVQDFASHNMRLSRATGPTLHLSISWTTTPRPRTCAFVSPSRSPANGPSSLILTSAVTRRRPACAGLSSATLLCAAPHLFLASGPARLP
jgi:hypothetical protein